MFFPASATFFLAALAAIGCKYSEIGGFIAIGTILLIIFLYLALDWPEHTGCQPNAAKNSYWKSVERKPNGTKFYVNESDKDRHEYFHRKGEKVYWIFSIALGSVTIIIAATAAMFAYFAYCATSNQAETARSELVFTQRAFVYLKSENHSFEYFAQDPTGIRYWALRPTWQNVGSTQPIDLTLETHCKISFTNTVPDFDILKAVRKFMGPKDERPGPSCAISDMQIATANIAGNALYVLFKARYKDIFSINGMLLSNVNELADCDLIKMERFISLALEMLVQNITALTISAKTITNKSWCIDRFTVLNCQRQTAVNNLF